jgi:hypothetical protein
LKVGAFEHGSCELSASVVHISRQTDTGKLSTSSSDHLVDRCIPKDLFR